MSKSEKNYSPIFKKYQDVIIKHKNYTGLEYGGSWVKAATSTVGSNRKVWADKKIFDLNITGNGQYAKLMFKIHPCKKKPCQICGKILSLEYVYPNKHFENKLISNFPYLQKINIAITSIYDILKIIKENKDEILFLNITKKILHIQDTIIDSAIIPLMIQKSRDGILKILGPGAMSNFPDRFDGFHSYNRCCRQKEDTGRSKKNLKSYSKDRRAYEEWSDGNHRAANQLMGNKIFLDNNLSADHL